MLVLTRKSDEQILIDGEITLTVIDIKGKRVRLGFDAPPEVSIHRREIADHIKHEEKSMEMELVMA